MSTPARPLFAPQRFEEAPDLGEVADAVTEAARGLRYGSIEVVVHDGRVVQVVRTEKRRITK